jgi:predicted Fe-S protein YdhL (DUF1289 family)
VAKEPLVRVRGGLKGFRWIKLSDWKKEKTEKRNKVLKTLSPRQQRMEEKRKAKRKKPK